MNRSEGCDREKSAVWREGCVVNKTLGLYKHPFSLTGCGVPELQVALVVARDDDSPVRIDCESTDRIARRYRPEKKGLRPGPYLNGLVASAGSKPLPVRSGRDGINRFRVRLRNDKLREGRRILPLHGRAV